MSIQSFYFITREKRKDSAQSSLHSLKGWSIGRASYSLSPKLFSDQSPGLRTTDSADMLGHDTGSGEEDGVPRVCMVGYIPGGVHLPPWQGGIYTGCTPLPSWVYLLYHPGYTSLYHPVYTTLCTPLLCTLCIPPCVHHCYTPGYTSVLGSERHNEARRIVRLC